MNFEMLLRQAKNGDRVAQEEIFRMYRPLLIKNLEQDNLQGRELRVVERKCGATKLYQYTDGSFPVISEETADMLILGEDGKFFHHDREHYIRLFRRVIPDKGFSYHEIRRYVLDKRRMSK